MNETIKMSMIILTSLVCVLGAIYLMAKGVGGWHWLLITAILFYVILESYKD